LFDLNEIYKDNNIYEGSENEKLDKLLSFDYGYEVLEEKRVQIQDSMLTAKKNELFFDESLSFEDGDSAVMRVEAERHGAYCFENDISFQDGLKKMQVYFCVKQKNQRKLNSHLWFFRAFCNQAKPKFVFFIDVGIEPEEDAFLRLYHTFAENENIAGVCGEIIPRTKDEYITDILFQTQVVEYKFAHIFDKSLESLIGYITVLPGAFSGYRYSALHPYEYDGPLWGHYFQSFRQPYNMNCYKSNIYLAEDRVLCMALITQKNQSYILKYNKYAVAYTDPPSDFSNLLLQRRRWINGSWFALLDAILNFKGIWMTNHNIFRKIFFSLEILYHFINVLYSFFIIGGFYLTLSICLRKQFPTGENAKELNSVGLGLLGIYLLMLLSNIILSLGSNIKISNKAFWTLSLFYSVYMIILLVLLLILFLNFYGSIGVWIPAVVIFGFYVILLYLNRCIWVVFKGIIQYLLTIPTYINIFTIYAVCNIHDCSWGNRPEEDLSSLSKNNSEKNDFEFFRAIYVIIWLLGNSSFAYSLDALNSSKHSYSTYIYYVSMGGLAILIIRFLGAFLFLFPASYRKCLFNKLKAQHDKNLSAHLNNTVVPQK
jgi:cellulose synthase/poly-beta-1,6-N-acetylglucosamine synthase-like glycosyltransferase